MAESATEFDVWLKTKLCSLNTDDEVFSPYIKGILECEDTVEEKKEALSEILSEILESDIEELCGEFLKKWTESCLKQAEIAKENEKDTVTVCLEDKLAKLMENTNLKLKNVVKENTTKKDKLKEAILAQYAQVSDNEEEGGKEEDMALPPGRSANVEAVQKAEKMKREQDKESSQKKKEKDKDDRAKQKAKTEDRKDKEKKRTQKGEKRR